MMINEIQLCGRCGQALSNDNACRRAGGKFQAYCRECMTAYVKERRQSNPEKYQEEKLKCAAASRRRREANLPAALDAERQASAKRRNEFQTKINFLKAERGGCYDCGGNFSPEGMDFDHVSGKKKFAVSSGVWRPWKDVREEIDKCQLVCAVCHRVRTKNRTHYGTATD